MNATIETVSVIIPTCDDPACLKEAIDSALTQTAGINIEVVVVDSSEGQEIKCIADNYGPEVIYEWIEPTGVAAARNHGIDRSTGDVIGFCDADDYWDTRKLEFQLPKIAEGYDIVYSDEYLIEDGSVSRLSSLPISDTKAHHVTFFRNGGGVGSRSVLVRRACLETERFDERFSVREDPHLWTRLFANYSVTRVAKPLSYKRRNSNGLTADRDRAYRMQLMEIEDLVEKFPELRPYQDERKTQTKLLYAKTLITDENRLNDARNVLLDLLQGGHIGARVAILLLISLLPAGNAQLLRLAQKAKWTVTN